MGIGAARRRYEQIRAQMRRTGWISGNEEPFFVAVFCNRCGVIASAPNVDELERGLQGWAIGDELGDDDYCPLCR